MGAKNRGPIPYPTTGSLAPCSLFPSHPVMTGFRFSRWIGVFKTSSYPFTPFVSFSLSGSARRWGKKYM